MRMGRRFPIEAQPENASHSEDEFRDTVSASASIGKAHPVLDIDNGMGFPFEVYSGKRVPESALRLGRSFRMAPQAETTTRNRAVEWDMLSQWQLKRKVHPGILIRNGMQFPNEWLAENSSQNRPSDWDVLSRRQLMLWGWLDRHALLNSKTCALSISKLGRRRPKRNRRRSI